MKITIDEGAFKPTRAHDADAGLDLYARESDIVPARGSACFDTGVHVQIPEGFGGFLKSKSGLNVRHDIISDGTIDSGYTGSIVAKLYNLGDTDYQVRRGDKITQLVITPVLLFGLEVVDTLEDTERGNGGFGSTGK